MNKFLLLLLTLISLIAKSQSIFNFKQDMVWVSNANLYVCKYEITNIEFRAFTDELIADTLNGIRRQSIIESYYPDTTVWIKQFKANMGKDMNEYYRWHPAFNGYPVVGVKYEAAIKFCEWMTKKHGKGVYKFRLPTKNEFIQYSQVNPFKIAGGIECPRNEKREYLINYKPNITNLDDSTCRVFYNPKNNTFMRIYLDTTKQHEDWGSEPYAHYVENSFNGYLYIGQYKNFYKFKIQDSITFYNKATNSYAKEKLILNVQPNYYVDGFLYTSPSRVTKDNLDPTTFAENWSKKTYSKPSFLPNKSSFPPDKNGLYDLAGNVSELVSEKGYAMGGNWDSVIAELNYDQIFIYEAPDVLIGFRIVAERLK